jgi:hypothetical protein
MRGYALQSSKGGWGLARQSKLTHHTETTKLAPLRILVVPCLGLGLLHLALMEETHFSGKNKSHFNSNHLHMAVRMPLMNLMKMDDPSYRRNTNTL